MLASGLTSRTAITGVRLCGSGRLVTVEFDDSTYTFHSQWLHDAQMDDGPYKGALDAYSCKRTLADIVKAESSGHGNKSTLSVAWADGRTAEFPSVWLRLYAPMVARCERMETGQSGTLPGMGWDATSLAMTDVSYTELFPVITEDTRLRVYEILGHNSFPGIIRITDLPEPDVPSERDGRNTLMAAVLKQIFGSVFHHPRRGAERTYNIASDHASDVQKGLLVPNYNTSTFLLPHVDQSFYETHTRMVGLYILEGESINTFVSGQRVLQTLEEEHPELVAPLYNTPMALGRAGKMYAPTQYQGTTTTAVTPRAGFPDEILRFRWHPHYVGALLCPFDEFSTSIEAHRKYQEIMDRPSHGLKLRLKPGDMYLFDNHRIFHGRDEVLKEPRTCVGQSTPEQVFIDGWREALIGRLLGFMEEKWLVHMPLMKLYEMDKVLIAS